MTQSQFEDMDVLETAADWFVRVRGGLDPAVVSEFEVWLSSSEANRRAFDQVSAGWATLASLGATPEMISLRRDALHNASKTIARRWRTPPVRSRWGAGMIAACAIFAVGIGGAYLYFEGVEHVYRTMVGQRRAVNLADGSVVLLDGATTLSVRYSARHRKLQLLAGQAEFEVAKDRARPFEVFARDRVVLATGTMFNVDLVSSSLTVTLIEGHVTVGQADPGRGGGLPVPMSQGQELVLDAAGRPRLRPNVDLSGALAWTNGKLVFDNQPLSQAVERVNRHAMRRVLLVDPGWTGVRFSGVFNAGDADAFVTGVTSQFPLRWRETESGDLMLYDPAKP